MSRCIGMARWKSKMGNTALEKAVQDADEKQIRTLLSENNLEEQEGYDLLCKAVDQGHTSVAEILLQAGAPGHRASADRLPPLVLTAYRNDLHLVRLLLRLGGSHSEEVLQEALFEAVVNGHDEAAALLVEAGAPVDHSADAQFDALAACCGKRCLRTAKALLAREVPRLALQRALHEALCKGQDSSAALLLKHGASLGPLAHEAAARGCSETLAMGLARGINPGTAGRHSLLHSAAQGFAQQLCSVETFFRTADLLLAAGAVVDGRDGLGRSPLMAGLLEGHEATDIFVTGMLFRGANPNLRDIFGTTPTHLIAETGSEEALITILEAGGHIDAEDWDGKRPLHVASAETVPVLLNYFADLSATDRRGILAVSRAKELARFDDNIAEELAVHMQTLNMAGLMVPNLEFLLNRNSSPYMRAARILNATELEYMRTARLLDVTYFDFIMTSPYKLVAQSQRKLLLEAAAAVDAKDIFPCYSGLWLKRIRQLSDKIRRDELVHLSAVLLNELTGWTLPIVVMDKLFTYFTADDLIKFTSNK